VECREAIQKTAAHRGGPVPVEKKSCHDSLDGPVIRLLRVSTSDGGGTESTRSQEPLNLISFVNC